MFLGELMPPFHFPNSGLATSVLNAPFLTTAGNLHLLKEGDFDSRKAIVTSSQASNLDSIFCGIVIGNPGFRPTVIELYTTDSAGTTGSERAQESN